MAACGGTQKQNKTSPSPDPLADKKGVELYEMARSFESQGDPIRAEQYYAAAITRGFDERKALEGLLRVCVQSSRIKSALSHAEPFLERNPEDWALRYLVASLHYGLGDSKEAAKHLRVLRERNPDFAEAYFLSGVVAQEAGEERAEGFFQSYVGFEKELRHRKEAELYLLELKDNAPSATERKGMQPLPKEPEDSNDDT